MAREWRARTPKMGRSRIIYIIYIFIILIGFPIEICMEFSVVEAINRVFIFHIAETTDMNSLFVSLKVHATVFTHLSTDVFVATLTASVYVIFLVELQTSY